MHDHLSAFMWDAKIYKVHVCSLNVIRYDVFFFLTFFSDKHLKVVR